MNLKVIGQTRFLPLQGFFSWILEFPAPVQRHACSLTEISKWSVVCDCRLRSVQGVPCLVRECPSIDSKCNKSTCCSSSAQPQGDLTRVLSCTQVKVVLQHIYTMLMLSTVVKYREFSLCTKLCYILSIFPVFCFSGFCLPFGLCFWIACYTDCFFLFPDLVPVFFFFFTRILLTVWTIGFVFTTINFTNGFYTFHSECFITLCSL